MGLDHYNIEIVQQPSRYRPFYRKEIDYEALVGSISEAFAMDRATVEQDLAFYRQFSEAKNYRTRFGELKTLSTAEAFIIYLLLKRYRPASIVEIGTQFGRSTRRIIDAKNHLALPSPVICYDVVDHVQHFSPSEAALHLNDVTHTVSEDVLDRYPPGLLFLDAHPYYLLKNVTAGVLRHPKPWILVIHDCGKGLCNPNMTLAREARTVTSTTGIWERHVLAELFGIPDPLSAALDHIEAARHRLDIFDTQHGLAVIVPRMGR